MHRARDTVNLFISRVNLHIPILTTEPNEFSDVHVNSIPFKVVEPQRCLSIIFRELVYDLWLSGIISFPHKNRLFFVLQIVNPSWVKDFVNALTNFLKLYPGCIDIDVAGAGSVERLAKLVELESLHPCSDVSHNVIVRSIVYGYLKKSLWKKGVTYFSKYVSKGKEGLVIYVDKLFNKDLGGFKVYILRGLRVFFEVTPMCRGRLWFDIVTHAFRDILGDRKRLSHNEMKNLSQSTGVDVYSKYLELAMLKPKNRYNYTIKYMDALGIRSPFAISYYVVSGTDRHPPMFNFLEFKRLFKDLHDVPQ